MRSSLFDYHLPKKLIAQRSARPRDRSRLLVLDRASGWIAETRFRNIGDFLRPGDLLVLNDTKVFRARLLGRLQSGGAVELLLLRTLRSGKKFSLWEALGRPARKLMPGTVVSGKSWQGIFRAPARRSKGVGGNDSRGVAQVEFPFGTAALMRVLARVGKIPVPPYVERVPRRLEDYQTVYARPVGSVAAPTAGFHFTHALIGQLKRKGVRFAVLTLHVGVGTFRPIVADDLREHRMHAEYAEVPAATLRAIRETKKRGGRVIAVGTTTVRALEGLLRKEVGSRKSEVGRRGWVEIFITPGYRFRVVDALITNFHLPRSTLLVLVSAFAGRKKILRAYRRAVRKKYRFYSFGDAMLIK